MESRNPLGLISPPELQVALDLDTDMKTIMEIAGLVYSAGARIIEAGTPAIKRHGADNLIPALRVAAPDAIIVADLKTMDAGDLEARIAFRAGADIVGVAAIGNEEKIIEAMDEALRWNKAILVDLIDCPDPLGTIMKIKNFLGPNSSRAIFCLHIGISLQKKGYRVSDQMEVIKRAKILAAPSFLAVAGGIKEETAGSLTSAGADICIVGSAIYKSSEPAEVTRRILREIKK
ncbi:MAG: orotidine 5'-phosphate decarboxylase / HUMPS family protein [Candidatus Hadarchaeales archaeon]